jgi:hypothetical protein
VGGVRVGVDLGQRVDPTAIVVAEEERVVVEHASGGPRRPESRFVVRHLERVELGTPYPAVAARVTDVCRSVEGRARAGWLVLDATGVGRPVVDLVVDAMGPTRWRVSAATFTGTDRVEGGMRSPELRVGKAWLVSRLQALLQTGRVRLPETPEARALARELLDYELRVTDGAQLATGAFRTGAHDDLVTALGLAVLEPSGGRGRSTSNLGSLVSANAMGGGEGWRSFDAGPRGDRDHVVLEVDGGWERRAY